MQFLRSWSYINHTARVTAKTIALSLIGATALIESGEEDLETALMQSKKVILSRFTDEFLREGDGNQLAVRETRGQSRPLQGLLNHC